MIEVNTFHEGTRLSTRCPTSSDEAQYSLPFPVAAILVRGQLGAAEVTGSALHDPAILRLSSNMVLIEDDSYNARFPAERWAHVSVVLNDGSRLASDPAVARGNPENPLTEAEILEKYHRLAEPVLGKDRTARLKDGVDQLARSTNHMPEFLNLLLEAVSS